MLTVRLNIFSRRRFPPERDIRATGSLFARPPNASDVQGDTPSPGRGSARRLAALAGPAAVSVSAVGILGSAALASWVLGSWFTWTGHALSDLGATGRVTAPLFNGSLVVGGVLGTAFGVRVWLHARNHWHRLGALLLGVGLLNAALVGVFNLPHPLHGPVAVTFFVTFTLGLFAHGSGDALAGAPRRGVRTIWLAVAHVAAWVALAVVPFDGIALPEFVGVLALWGWTVQTYRVLR